MSSRTPSGAHWRIIADTLLSKRCHLTSFSTCGVSAACWSFWRGTIAMCSAYHRSVSLIMRDHHSCELVDKSATRGSVIKSQSPNCKGLRTGSWGSSGTPDRMISTPLIDPPSSFPSFIFSCIFCIEAMISAINSRDFSVMLSPDAELRGLACGRLPSGNLVRPAACCWASCEPAASGLGPWVPSGTGGDDPWSNPGGSNTSLWGSAASCELRTSLWGSAA